MKRLGSKVKYLTALLVAFCLCAGMIQIPALAATYEAPDSGIAADNDVYLSGATAAANTVVLSMLGINVTSSDGAGIYQASGNTTSYGTDSSNLGIFGSNFNDHPDPYLYNFFYNLNHTESGGSTYSEEDYKDWTATPYALVWGENKSGPTGGANGTVTISVAGVTKTTNPAFFYEPDILLSGGTNGYATELSNYQAEYNEEYNPTIFLGYGTGSGQYAASGSRSDGLGLEYNQFDMTRGVVYLGSVIQNVMNETGKVNRYDQGTYEIAVDYDKFDRGLYYYVLSEIENGNLTQVRYTSSLSYDGDTDFYIVSKGTGREAQYASGLGVDIYDLLDEGYEFSDGSTVEKTASVSTGGDNMGDPGGNMGGGLDGGGNAGAEAGGAAGGGAAGGGAGGNAGGEARGNAEGGAGGNAEGEARGNAEGGAGGNAEGEAGGNGGAGGMGGESDYGSFYLSAGQLIEILNYSDDENATGVVIGTDTDSLNAGSELTDAGIRFLSNLPTCVYGMTMQTVENGMGIPYYAGFFYYAQDQSLNPVNYIYYWMEHFYHVSDNSAMESVVTNMLEDASLPNLLNGSSGENYSPEEIEEQIIKGINYYLDVLEPSYDEDSSSALYWTALDTSVGIGSDLRDTNVNAQCRSAESFTDDYDNAIYSFVYTNAAGEEITSGTAAAVSAGSVAGTADIVAEEGAGTEETSSVMTAVGTDSNGVTFTAEVPAVDPDENASAKEILNTGSLTETVSGLKDALNDQKISDDVTVNSVISIRFDGDPEYPMSVELSTGLETDDHSAVLLAHCDDSGNWSIVDSDLSDGSKLTFDASDENELGTFAVLTAEKEAAQTDTALIIGIIIAAVVVIVVVVALIIRSRDRRA